MATKKKALTKQEPATGMLAGRVTLVNIKGDKANSGQLLITVETGGPAPIKMPLVVGIPGQEGAVFAALSSFVTLAYLSQHKIGLTYVEAHPTNRLIEAFFPAPQRDKKKKKK